MRPHTLPILLTLFAIAADSPTNQAAQKEMKKLEGAWSMVSLEVNANLTSEEDAKNFKLEVAGDKWNVSINDHTIEATYRVDPTKSPKEIDLTYLEGPIKGQPIAGIYLLEGDTLKMCRCQEPNKDRPTEFATLAGSGLLLVVWKRVK
jgi:uncharacterized protein (TIGR03067 family)